MNSPPYQNNFVNMESAGVFPRVAHRHMYLWIEQQIELKVKAGGPIFSSQVDSLDQFRQEVIVANENNKHFSQLKLQELIDKAAPYSLLYNRNLNMSTNVLKRWNRSNGMINWFLRKINRGPPTAADVIQVARVHLARTLMKRSDCSHLFTSVGKEIVLGKRPRVSASDEVIDEDSMAEQTGPTPVTASSIDELYAYLKSHYQPGIVKEAVASAVKRDIWHRDGDSYQPNIRKLDGWSPENGCWQHFSHYCNEHHVKHDQFLFEFATDKASRENKKDQHAAAAIAGMMRKPRAAAAGVALASESAAIGSRAPRGSKKQAVGGGGGAGSARGGGGGGGVGFMSGMGPSLSAAGSFSSTSSSYIGGGGRPSSTYPGARHPHLAPQPFTSQPPYYGANPYHGRTSSYPHEMDMGDYSQNKSGGGGAAGGGPRPKKRSLREVFIEFRLNLIKRVTSLSSPDKSMEIRFLGSKVHDWNDADIQAWSDRSIQSAEIYVLFPYFMRVDNQENALSAPRSIMVGHPVTGYVQQVGTYTFSYGEDRYLSICAYLVGEGPESRFFGKYILSTKETILTTFGYAPVSLDPRGKSPTYVHKDDLASFQLWWLAESSSRRNKITAKTLPLHPKELLEVLQTSATCSPHFVEEGVEGGEAVQGGGGGAAQNPHAPTKHMEPTPMMVTA